MTYRSWKLNCCRVSIRRIIARGLLWKNAWKLRHPSGVPLVAMSGDEASIAAIRKEVYDKVPAAVVKKGLGRYNAICLHPAKAQRLIKEAVIAGLNQLDDIPPLIFKNPVTVDLIHHDHFNAYAHKFFVPSDERVSPVHTRFIASDARDAYYGFLARDKLSKARHN